MISFEERLKLMKLLVRKIRVPRIEPEKFADKLPEGSLVTQIRNSRYRLDFDFYIKSLFRDFCAGQKKLHRVRICFANGGAGGIAAPSPVAQAPFVEFRSSSLVPASTDGLFDCVKWRRGRDSNPRYRFQYTSFPGMHNRPLCHLS